jgi:hypothetical protein
MDDSVISSVEDVVVGGSPNSSSHPRSSKTRSNTYNIGQVSNK